MHETFDHKEYEDCYLLLSEACFFYKDGFETNPKINSCSANRHGKNVMHW